MSKVSLIGAVLTVVAACSASNEGSSPPGPNGGMSETASVCSKESTANSCQDCCGYSDELALQTFDAFDLCACETRCKAQCGSTYCTPGAQEVSAECSECIYPACLADADKACLADARCKPYAECTVGAQCEKKRGGLEDPNRR